MAKNRTAKLSRKTKETDIKIELNIDGNGESKIDTGLKFLDNMLESFSKHGFFDLKVKAIGDIDVDDHHICEAIFKALARSLNSATQITHDQILSTKGKL